MEESLSECVPVGAGTPNTSQSQGLENENLLSWLYIFFCCFLSWQENVAYSHTGCMCHIPMMFVCIMFPRWLTIVL